MKPFLIFNFSRLILCTALLASSTLAIAAGVDQGFQRDSRLDSMRMQLTKAFGQGRQIALLVGVSEYRGAQTGGFRTLSSTRGDVEKMRKFLIESAGFDYVHVLTEENVTVERVNALMEDYFPEKVGASDRFIFYWSGHGVARNLPAGRREGYLPLANSKRDVYAGMISMSDLRRWNDLLAAKQTLFILDACVSGLAGQESKADLAALTIEQLNRPSRHLLVAGTSDEETISGDRWGGSIFTDALIRGASGEAALTTGVVGLTDLLSYVRRYVAIEKENARWGRTISPQLRDFSASNGEFYFTSAKPKIAQALVAKPAMKGFDAKGEAAEPQDTVRSDVGSLPPHAAKTGLDRRRTSWMKAADLDVMAQIHDRFSTSPALRDVKVNSYNRVVLLTGSVFSQTDKADAERIAAGVPNVRTIIGELTLRAPQSDMENAQDVVLASKVEAVLREHLDWADSINVVVERGDVYLLGFATEKESELAAEKVATVAGVSRVIKVFNIVTESELRAMLSRGK